MLVQHLITHAVRVLAHLRQRGIGQPVEGVFAGIRHIGFVVGVSGDVVQQRGQRAVARAVGVHDLLGATHIRCNVGEDTQRVDAVFMTHGAAELVLVKFGDSARQQRVLGFPLALFFREARHVQPDRPGGAEHQIHPVQRLIRRQQRIAFAGQRFGFFFIHRQNRDVFFQEGLPPLRVVGNDEFGAQRQNHRHVVFLRILNCLHGCVRHWFARLAAHQIRRQHQRRRARDHLFRDTFSAQLVHIAGADGKGTLAGIAYQRKATTNRPVNALQIVQIGAAGGIAQVAVGVATDFDIAAHHAKQHRAVVCQNGVVVHGVTDGAASKLVGDKIFAHQVLIQRFGNVILNHQRVPGAQTVTCDKRIIHFGFNVHQRLIDTDHPGSAGFAFLLNLL